MPIILLVEDDGAVRKVLRQMLVNIGYEVLEAGSAPEALNVAASYPNAIDLLITDVVMPHTNCDLFVDQLRENRPELKVIFISGYSEEILKRHGVTLDRPNFIQKPFRLAALSDKLAEVLGDRRSRSACKGQ